MSSTLLWYRDDLRVADHPALSAAVGHAEAPGDVVAVYVLDETSPGVRPLGGAVKWWLHYALESLRGALEDLGIPLVLRSGDPSQIIPELARTLGVDRVHWTRRYGGPEREVDAGIKEDLPEHGIEVESFPGTLLHEPWRIQTQTGGPYKVFTPFWRALSGYDPGTPLDTPSRLGDVTPAKSKLSGSGVRLGDLTDLDLLPTAPDWAGGLRERWTPTEDGAHAQLAQFLKERIDEYDDARDIPAEDGTSNLSPYLRFGQIGPRQVWHSVHQSVDAETLGASFLSELGWREFCWHLLYHFPELPETNLRSNFDAYPWRSRAQEPAAFRAWAFGNTGFAWVDAGQRELWETGHMHNRVRMASASLLVKNLGIHWREGEAWFWDTLVDADAASNPANWQWVAGCGADAAPYFRIFNPERQLQRFDPQETYVRRWIPELGTDDYAEPIVDLKESRQEALAQYDKIK
ncbi:MAG TPA: DNA photolyase family protein [Candidatus Nesterenkonia stercoripullorum]|uniref:DNA photolyase family protein n=1 Tax=Candidatus Nesterenkonia stercoripullorum TaxID=2838701 RepID=A0A9D2A974_9MICC|nr:DNA photolyase family protein [Candidatus Nesterenkonia stercoripullorum]